MYIIYEIPGKKVGCTQLTIEEKAKWYPKGTNLVVIEVCNTPKEAGDREKWWQIKKGYKVDTVHYSKIPIVTMDPEKRRQLRSLMGRKGNSRNGGLARAKALTPERSSEIGRKAGKASAESKTFEQKSKQGHEAGLRSRINLTKEQSSEIGRKAGLVGGRKAASLQKSGAHIRVHCPHCGLESNLMVLKRWHFDKCKLNPNHSMNNSPPMT